MQSTFRMGPRKPRAERAQILAARAQSELTDRQFATQHGIAVTTLYRWQRQRSPSPRRDPAALIEIPNRLNSRPTGAPYRLRFPRGLILEVASGFAAEELRSLAQLLQSL